MIRSITWALNFCKTKSTD